MPKKRDEPLLGENFRKVQPKLRMISNSKARVNTVRSEMCAALSVESVTLRNEVSILRDESSAPLTKEKFEESHGSLRNRRGTMDSVPSNIYANVFIETLDAAAGGRAFAGERARKSTLVTARVPLSKLRDIAARDNVLHVELGEPLAAPTPAVAAGRTDPPAPALRKVAGEQHHNDGEGVLIGIIDVQGFDFSHPDFLDSKGRTRFVRVWDQGAEPGFSRPAPKGSKQFSYGAELTAAHMNAAIKASPRLKLPAYELERQSQIVPGSHATHVASIAAGNLGVCRKAMIAGVLISMPQPSTQKGMEQDRRNSFYDSTRVADAVDYLIRVAEELSAERGRPVPLSINVSLGTNGHAHDGSSAISRWIDSAMSVPGRCISVAAGNAGQEVAEFEGDMGYVTGRIHTSGAIPARGLVRDIEWVVVGNGYADISENELELWYSPQDRFAISIRPPGSARWIGPVEPQQYIENRLLDEGCFLSVYNELYHPSNGANYISVYLSPFFAEPAVVGIPSGNWMIRLHGVEVRDGRYHGWIERDDPRRRGRVGGRETWSFPSFFSAASNVDNSSVSSLACGHRVLSVANLDEAAERINISSSQGPTRDNRYKPDTAAPGTKVVAAKGFAGPDDLWVAMTGTSMASPYVAGVAGLMLATAKEPKLTAAQVEGIIVRTARPLPGDSFVWRDNAGFGRINPDACIEEALNINVRKDITK
ncbi:MAG TPA: S8 family serine peptidase [Pyrinomonadaceae bacterium]|nr:S8 family serine peptidase [Pyrinomonadaceae bacterium]